MTDVLVGIYDSKDQTWVVFYCSASSNFILSVHMSIWHNMVNHDKIVKKLTEYSVLCLSVYSTLFDLFLFIRLIIVIECILDY